MNTQKQYELSHFNLAQLWQLARQQENADDAFQFKSTQ